MDTAIAIVIIIGAGYFVFKRVRNQLSKKNTGCGCSGGSSCCSPSNTDCGCDK